MAKRKKINPRVLLVICVLGLLLVGFVVTVIIQRLPKDPTTDIRIAEEEAAKEKPDWLTVFRHLGTAIRNSQDQAAADLLFREAELRFERLRRDLDLSRPQQDELRQRGWQALEQAVRKDGRHLKARKMLADLRGTVAQYNPDSSKAWLEYIEELDGVLAVDPQDAAIYFRRGQAYAHLAMTDPQQQNKAVEDFRKAVELDKTKVEYWDALARYLVSIDRISEAEQTFREAIQANPNKAMLRVSYARLLRGQKRLEEANKLTQEAIQCEPSSPLGYLDQAGDLIRGRKFDPAEEVLEKARQIDKTDPQVYAQFVTLYRLKKDLPAADRIVREGIAALDQKDAEAEPDDKMAALRRGQTRAILNYLLAEVLLDQYALSKDEKEKEKLLQESKERLEVLETLSPNQLQQHQIAGRISYYEQKWPEARESLEKVVEYDTTPRTAMLLLNVYRRLGIPGQSEKLAENFLKRRISPRVRLLFLLELAQLQLDLREYDKAQELVHQAEKIDSKNENIKRLQQALNVYRGKTTEVLSEEGDAGRVARAMLFRRVQDLILNDQYDQAETVLETMLQHNPHDLQALAQLLALLMESQKRDKALEWLSKSRALDPENEDLKRFEDLLKESSMEKRYAIEMGYVDRAPTEDKLNKALQKWNIARRYRREEDARNYLDEAEAIDPNNSIVVNLRFRQALAGENWTAAEELIERIPEGESGYLRNLRRAELAMARGEAETAGRKKEQADAQYTKALSYLQNVVEAAPHLPAPRLLMAESYLRLGKREDARKQFRECYENNRQNLQAVVGLAQLAQDTGRYAERNRWIEEAYQIPSGKADPYVREQYLQILESDPKNLGEVIHKREQVLKHDPDNLINAFRLAAAYEKSGQINRAQEMIEYLYQRTPNKITIAPMLADLYLRMKQPLKADEMFSDLLKDAKTAVEKADIRIAYGDFLARNDEDAAVRMYEKAVAEEGEDGTHGLRALSNFRAAQAQFLASRGKTTESQTRWKESIDLLQTVIKRLQKSVDSLQAKADGDPSNSAAQQNLTRAQQELQQMRLALLGRYIDSDQYDNAVAGYQKMIQADPEDAQARLGLGLAYLENDQLNQAEEQFTEAIKIQSDLPNAYLLRSRVYQSKMELSRAAADIAACADLTGNVEQKMDLARIYEAMNDFQQAGRIYDTIIADNPEYFNAYEKLLNLFRQQKRWSALEALANKGMDVFPEIPAFALQLAAAAEEQGDKDSQRHWLERAAETAPDAISVVRRYWVHLLENRDYIRLQREAQKYGRRPAQTFGAQAVLAAAQAKQNPGDAKSFQALLSLLQSAKNSTDVYFVGHLFEEAYGSAKIASASSDILKARPEDWNLHAFLGDVCLQEKQYRQAERYYQEALKLCKNTSGQITLNLRLAQLYSSEGAYPKVEEQYLAVLKNNPNHRMALNNLAYTYIDQLNRPEEGLKLIQRVMKATPGDPNLVDTYAWALVKLERFEEARAMFEKVVEIGGAGGAERLYHMGYVLEKTDSPREAERYYRQALEVARAQKNVELQATIETAMARVERK
ncbi:MAG: tetratricopeptide repeat protein [Phycisphaerae bacterium]|nr:tetratricopeptide repeat protein [Phycisphaerae bacterium]